MKRNTNKMSTKKYITILVISFIFLNVLGYALISSSVKWQKEKADRIGVWDVSFKNIEVDKGSVDAVVPATISSNGDEISYIVDLINQDDYYKFQVDVVNDGTLDAKVDSIFKSSLSPEQQQLIDFDVTYTDGSFITKNDLLEDGQSKEVTVLVKYKDGIDLNKLSADLAEIDLKFSINYVQAN